MGKMLSSRTLWWVGGALLFGLGWATARAARFDLDPWDDSFYA